MSSYNFFGATADDVLRRLSGSGAQLTISQVEAAMSDAEARIEAALPDRYRRLLSCVEGDVIVRAATEGQAEAAIGLPAAAHLVLYADLACPYPDRSAADEMDPSAYTLDEAGEKVAFSPPLSRGTRVVADYETTLANGLCILADMLAVVATADLMQAHCHGQSDKVEAALRNAAERLAALADGSLGVPELDKLTLYDDWERAPRGVRCGHLVRS
ncbi:MAG TPA: hypothetical protein VNE39_16265 [Planctomycetota bacterium]|nr:hypothetical protein [Planctomycetota bacterium]